MLGINKSNLNSLLEKISAGYTLFVPAQEEGISRFVPYQAGMELYWEKNTVFSPKEVFFPQTEHMYGYEFHKNEASVVEIAAAEEQRVLFGIRPCDAQSIAVLDDVFLTKVYEDYYYKIKRENTLVIALGCKKAEETCFCTSFGIDPTSTDCADILMQDTGEALVFEAKTTKGEEFLKEFSAQLQEMGEPAKQEVSCTLEVTTEGLTEKLQKMFEHEIWGEICRKCLNCGTCTYLCPTCHCFDIQSKTRGEKGIKFRCWDSCMYKEYTLMAGGHNPRPTKKERVRQRFLHKLQYMPERYSKWGCVGCGRCLIKCPVNLDIVQVIRKVGEVRLDA